MIILLLLLTFFLPFPEKSLSSNSPILNNIADFNTKRLEKVDMRITSPKFKQGGAIPKLYTCEGFDWNPPVEFHDVPKAAKSLVLIMEDPDVPESIRPDRTWIHWVVYEIRPDAKGIPEHSAPPGTHGRGTNGRTAYMGPCPPDREHRYFFYLFAIDFMPDWPKGMTKDEVIKKIEGHIIAKAELMGTYKLEKPIPMQ